MLHEIEKAADWWATKISHVMSPQKINEFKKSLQHEFETKYKNHWYCEEPQRGSGFRSVLVDNVRTDCILKKVAVNIAGPSQSKLLLENHVLVHI